MVLDDFRIRSDRLSGLNWVGLDLNAYLTVWQWFNFSHFEPIIAATQKQPITVSTFHANRQPCEKEQEVGPTRILGGTHVMRGTDPTLVWIHTFSAALADVARGKPSRSCGHSPFFLSSFHSIPIRVQSTRLQVFDAIICIMWFCFCTLKQCWFFWCYLKISWVFSLFKISRLKIILRRYFLEKKVGVEYGKF